MSQYEKLGEILEFCAQKQMMNTYVHLALQAAQEQPAVLDQVYNAFSEAPDTLTLDSFLRLPKMGQSERHFLQE